LRSNTIIDIPGDNRRKRLGTLLGLAIAVVVYFLLNTVSLRISLFWVFGLGLGVVLQRSRFCLVSTIKSCLIIRDTSRLEGMMIGLFIATIGFTAIMARMMPDPGPGFIRSAVVVSPFGWHLMLGGILFGAGAMLCGGCVVGHLYRLGEGSGSSAMAFIGILVGMGALQFNWPWWWNNYISRQAAVWLPAKMGWTAAVGMTLAVITVLYFFLRCIVRKPVSPESAEVCLCSLPQKRRLPERKIAIFKAAWSPAAGWVMLGIINVLMYLTLERPWTVTGEIMSWAQGVCVLLRIPVPPLQAVPGTCVVGGAPGQLTWGLVLNIGIIGGSFLAAMFSGDFRLLSPRWNIVSRLLLGGLLMGYGAGLASSCFIGGFFSAVPSLGLNGFAFGASIFLGAFATLLLMKRINPDI